MPLFRERIFVQVGVKLGSGRLYFLHYQSQSVLPSSLLSLEILRVLHVLERWPFPLFVSQNLLDQVFGLYWNFPGAEVDSSLFNFGENLDPGLSFEGLSVVEQLEKQHPQSPHVAFESLRFRIQRFGRHVNEGSGLLLEPLGVVYRAGPSEVAEFDRLGSVVD